MDDVPLAGEGAEFLAQRGDGVDGSGLFAGLVVVGLGVVVGLRGVLTGLVGGRPVGVLGLRGGLVSSLGGLVSGLDLVRGLGGTGLRGLNDVVLVLGGLEGVRPGLGGVVQVRVRHDGCFFLDTNGWNMRKGRR